MSLLVWTVLSHIKSLGQLFVKGFGSRIVLTRRAPLEGSGMTLVEKPKHWRAMEDAVAASLVEGDILYAHLDDLSIDRLSHVRLLLARPAEQRMMLLSASMAPEDDLPAVVEKEVPIGAGTAEIGLPWSRLETRTAMKAARAATDGTLAKIWMRVWGDDTVHIVGVVARQGMHDSLQTIEIRRPKGSFFRRQSAAQALKLRPLPKLFSVSGAANVFGGAGAGRAARPVVKLN